MLPLRLQVSDFIFHEVMTNGIGEGVVINENGSMFLKVGKIKIPVVGGENLPANSLVKFSIGYSEGKKQIIIHSWTKIKEAGDNEVIGPPPNLSVLDKGEFVSSKKVDIVQMLTRQIQKINVGFQMKTEVVFDALNCWFNDQISLGLIIDRLNAIFRKLGKEGGINKEVIAILDNLYFNSRLTEGSIIERWLSTLVENYKFISKLFELGKEGTKEKFSKELLNRFFLIRLLSECKNESVLTVARGLGLEREIKFLGDALESKLLASQLFSLLSINRCLYVIEVPICIGGNNWVRVYLNLDNSREQKNEKTDYNIIAISINLENMGRLWIELKSFMGILTCLIKVEKKSSYQVLLSSIDELKEKICSTGVSKVSIWIDRLKESELECFWKMLVTTEGVEVLV